MAAEERSDGATGPEAARHHDFFPDLHGKESEHERLTTGGGADHSGSL